MPYAERPPVVSSGPLGTTSNASHFTVEQMQHQGHKALMSSSRSTACCKCMQGHLSECLTTIAEH